MTLTPHLARYALVALTVLAAMAPAKKSRAQARPFGPAESLTYTCRFLGINIATGKVMVGGPTAVDGRNVWPIVGFVKTDPLFVLYPVKDKFVTWWDPKASMTVGSDLTAEEKGKRRRERVRYDREQGRVLSVNDGDDGRRDERSTEIAQGTQDMLAAIFALREKRLAIGDHEEIPVFTGKRSFTLKADIERKDTVEVHDTTYAVIVMRVEVQFSGSLQSKREVRVYVTDDARKIPVRIDAEFAVGSVVLDLIEYQKGLDA